MKDYEKPILRIQELFKEDIVTASLNGSDDSGEWQDGWSNALGGNGQ